MNKILIFVITLFLTQFSFSQVTNSQTEQEERNGEIEDSLLNIEQEKHNGHFSGIDVGLNTLLNSSFTTSFPTAPQWNNDIVKSFNFNFNFYDHKILLYKEKVGLVLGLGLNLSKIAFDGNWTLNEVYSKKDSVVYGDTKMDTLNFTRNKLHLAYIQIPFLIEFTPVKNFWISAGVIAGMKLSSNVRQIYTDPKNPKYEYERTIKGSFALNTFKCDATVRFGFGSSFLRTYGAYVSYALIPMFNSTLMANVHPLSFGLNINI